jgi:apolipoprotein D and lipocalin family protein
MKKIYLLLCFLLGGCTQIPEGIEPVRDFNLNSYIGKWYEIARLDHSFERGLTQVTAEYSLREDGAVHVINRGYSQAKNEWKSAEGKARFVRTAEEGYLKVSFFGPFYGAYVVFELDHQDYSYALVCGPNRDYLWLLARQPVLPDAIKSRLVATAKALGFATEKLIFVAHDTVK